MNFDHLIKMIEELSGGTELVLGDVWRDEKKIHIELKEAEPVEPLDKELSEV